MGENLQRYEFIVRNFALGFDVHRRYGLMKVNVLPRFESASVDQRSIPHPVAGCVVHSDAVIGMVEFYTQTFGSSMLENSTQWRVKRQFYKTANKLAVKFEVEILQSTGEGFVFIANGDFADEWPERLTAFYENLCSEFNHLVIKNQLGGQSGMRIGVSRGPTLIGRINAHSSERMAVGRESTLSYRLCKAAKPNEMVVSPLVWEAIKPVVSKYSISHNTHMIFAGVFSSVEVTHLKAAMFENHALQSDYSLPRKMLLSCTCRAIAALLVLLGRVQKGVQ
jgi:hypothetical protein